MTARKNKTVATVTTTESLTFRDNALAIDQTKVDKMIEDIRASFARRDVFEASQGNKVDATAKNGYTKAREAVFKNEIAVARLLLACGVSAESVFEYQNNESSMWSVYGIDKLREIAQYTVGVGASIQAVTKAFVLCSVAAAQSGVTVITNDVNRKFLNNMSVDSLGDEALIEYVTKNRHKSISTGDATQSSQMRGVIERLACGERLKVIKPNDAVTVKADSELLCYLVERFKA